MAALTHCINKDNNMKNILLGIILLCTPNLLAKSIQIEMENDVFSGGDRYYTHGTRITYEEDQLQWFLQQNIYTPQDISIDTPIINDRPYAGLLCVGLRGTKQWYFNEYEIRRIYHQLEMSVGVVGKYSLAEQTQKLTHDWLDSRKPMGWDYQSNDRLWLHSSLIIYGEVITTRYLNIRSLVLVDAGTVISDIGFGGEAMVGYNIPKYNDKPMISQNHDFSVYVFGSWIERHFFYNKFLESDYTDITIRKSVSETRVGIGASYKMLYLQYGFVERGREFNEQIENSTFGSISIKVDI